jgi:uncharacterized protein (DUF2126 family)
MTTRVALTHRIEQRFVRPVTLATHWVRLRPAPHARAAIDAYSLDVRTAPHFLNWVRDIHGNHVARLDLPEPVPFLGIDVDLVVTLADASPFDFLVDPAATTHPFAYEPELAKELAPCLVAAPAGPRLAAWLADLPRDPAYVVDRLATLTTAMHARFGRAGEDVAGPPDLDAVLAREAGTPREIAWLFVQALRALGLASRFVTGYRVTTGGTAPSASLHTWCETHLPGAGWIGLDPSAGLFTTDAWIPLACAADPLRAAPLVGFREWCDERTSESLVARVLDPTPSAWPYADVEWAAVERLARQVEGQLEIAGARLAIRRELAFTSVRQAGAAEWTTTALGGSKQGAAGVLVRTLGTRIVPGAVVQAGTGDCYAGEPEPRWRLFAVGRADGRPAWSDPSLLDAAAPPMPPGVYVVEFAETLAHALGVPASATIPAYEDPLGCLGRDDRAAFAMPPAAELADPERRRALAERLSEHFAPRPAGVVIPLAWDPVARRWRSGTWRFRRRRLYLLEGTLPIGVRLPLESLPATTRNELDGEPCPLTARGALGDPLAVARARLATTAPNGRDGRPAPRAALCVEVRAGRLRVFLPPTTDAERYLALVAAVEATATALRARIALEGYGPPDDVRLRTLRLEPDAGVLRLSLPRVGAGDAALLAAAYDEASALGLRAERTLADGGRAPVGATAPVVLGGPTPDASPFLARPELLRALVVHWQRHPSLSHLFSTRMVGAGGAAVRPDEGRDDALHELAIALDRFPAGRSGAPWIGDRLLRHLLADASGDMRRAEIGMESLYDPERASRRLGEIALRTFDTPPCARMATLQSLLVAALVARFAFDPRPGELERFGATLQDRFLLPSALWEDLRLVLADLASAGLAFRLAWFEPFRDLHFPLLGRVEIGDVALELRPAHEPWPVLAEEATGGGLARFVDTANDRVEIRAIGVLPERHVLACNGRHVPLRANGVLGEQIAGVRFKTWSPAATLHPTTSPVGLLVFDLIDAWTGRAIGGCRFFPSRPSLVGPVAAVPASDETRRERGRPAQLVAAPLTWQRSALGRFLAGGSGLGPMRRPNEAVGTASLLDLTAPA